MNKAKISRGVIVGGIILILVVLVIIGYTMLEPYLDNSALGTGTSQPLVTPDVNTVTPTESISNPNSSLFQITVSNTLTQPASIFFDGKNYGEVKPGASGVFIIDTQPKQIVWKITRPLDNKGTPIGDEMSGLANLSKDSHSITISNRIDEQLYYTIQIQNTTSATCDLKILDQSRTLQVNQYILPKQSILTGYIRYDPTVNYVFDCTDNTHVEARPLIIDQQTEYSILDSNGIISLTIFR